MFVLGENARPFSRAGNLKVLHKRAKAIFGKLASSLPSVVDLTFPYTSFLSGSTFNAQVLQP